jgi:coenzyme Q-binding protein COQ10
MPKLNFTRHVPFTPEQMLSLVADLNSYPNFVPNCIDMQVTHDGEDKLAKMSVKFGPIEQAYTSRVSIDEKEGIVRAVAIDGPFSHLDSGWEFIKEEQGSLIKFDIDFGFSNRLIAAVVEPAFEKIQSEILDAFILEAKSRFS